MPPRPRPRPRSTRATLQRAAGVLLAVVVTGCLSPTLPLPPPGAPDAVRGLDGGRWEILGQCSPGAVVTAMVERTGQGAIVEDREADGRYRVEVEADACDVVLLSQIDGEEGSAQTRVVLQHIESGAAVDTDECAR
jgi:hypothetical protein